MLGNRPRTSPSKPHHHVHQLQRCKSSYNRGWLQQKQQAQALYLARETASANKAHADIEFLSKTEKSALRYEIKKRVDHMMLSQEKELEIRRTRLNQTNNVQELTSLLIWLHLQLKKKSQKLLENEAEALQREALIYRQHQQDLKLKEMERRRDDLAKQRDEENKRVVEEKRIQQSMARCHELRPHLFQKNLLDSKEVQLQQIKENEERKRNEKEVRAMWDDVTHRDVRAKLISDRDDAVENQRKQRKQKEDLDLQIKEKELLKLDDQRIKLETQIEMERFDSVVRQKEIERLKEERKKKETYIAELTRQIGAREKLLVQRAVAKRKADEKFAEASKLEREQEMAKAKETAVSAQKEATQYVRSLTELLRQRQEEERKLEELLENHREQSTQQEHESVSQIQRARSKLHQNVLEGRRAQIESQNREALRRLKQKEEENALMRLAVEEHRRSEEENARRHADAARQYRCDLQKQIDYNNSMREEQRQKSLRELELERREEEKLRKHAYDAIAQKSIQTTKHPFRKVLGQEDDTRTDRRSNAKNR